MLDILIRRVKTQINQYEYRTPNGAIISGINANDAFSKYISALRSTSIPETLFELCNSNFATTFALLNSFSKSQSFPLEKFFVSSLFLQKDLQRQNITDERPVRYNLNENNILNFLLYGNVGEDSMYYYPGKPLKNKIIIPNLLNWNITSPDTFLLNFRIYQIVRREIQDKNGKMLIPLVVIFHILGKYFSINENEFMSSILFLEKNELLKGYENKLQSYLNDYDAVTICPKMEKIIQLTKKSGVLITAYFDDFEIPEDIHLLVKEEGNFSVKSHPKLLISFLKFTWRREKDQLNKLSKLDLLDSYIIEFNRDVWTKYFTKTIEERLQSMIKNEQKKGDSKRIERLSSILSEIEYLSREIDEFLDQISWNSSISYEAIDKTSQLTLAIPDLLAQISSEIDPHDKINSQLYQARQAIKLGIINSSKNNNRKEMEQGFSDLYKNIQNVNTTIAFGKNIKDIYYEISKFMTGIF